MCNPLAATAMALTAGGSVLETRAANKNAQRAQSAKEAAFQAHQGRQRAFQDESGAAFNTNVQNQGRDNFDVQKENDTQRRIQAFNDIRSAPDYNEGIPNSAPKNVVLNRQAEADRARTETDRDVSNNAKLSGYGGAMFNQGMDQNAFARMFGNIQDKAAGDTRLLPLEMQAAATNSQKSPGLFPTLLKTAGQGLGMYNAANPGAIGNQKIDPGDMFNAGARKDIGYSLKGGLGPYRF
jgi:hypothetical protein